MIARDDEVSAEYRNSLVEIYGSGVPAHRLRAMLLTVGCDGVTVFEEVAQGPVNSSHPGRLGMRLLESQPGRRKVRRGPEMLVFPVI